MRNLFSNPIASIIGEAGKVVDSLTTSDEERAEARLKLEALHDAPYARQAAVTLEEAKHPSIFVAGWRPFIGWSCGVGLCFTVLIWPLATVGARFAGIELGDNPVDHELILAILPALLGIAGLRTYEKARGIARANIK